MARFWRYLLALFRRWRGDPVVYWKQGSQYIERTTLTSATALRTAVRAHLYAGRVREARIVLQSVNTPEARAMRACVDDLFGPDG